MPLLSATILWFYLLSQVALANPQATTRHASLDRAAFTDTRTLFGESKEQCCHAAGSAPKSLNQSSLPKNIAFLVGAQKSGTTFLFHELVARHPKIKSHRVDICTPQRTKLSIPMKEPHFFDRIPLGNWDKYLQRFQHERDPSATYLDATPDYIHIPSTPCRVASVFPDAKIVVMLKDPVMRALSGWNMVRHQGRPGVKTFGEEVQHELKVLRKLQCSYEVQQPAASGGTTRSRSGQRAQRSMAGARVRRRALGLSNSTAIQALGSAGGAAALQKQAQAAKPALAQGGQKPTLGKTSSSAVSPAVSKLLAFKPVGSGGSSAAAAAAAAAGTGQGAAGVAGQPPGTSSSHAAPSSKSKGSGAAPGSSPVQGSGSKSSSTAAVGEPEGSGSRTEVRWQRHAALPSWNSCFRCDFSYCNGYTGPTDGHICRQDRAGTLGNLRRGLYVYQLEWWLQHFPPEQLLVVNYEHFVHDREGVLDLIIRFLGQDPKLKKSPEFNKKKGFFTPHAGNMTVAYSKVIDELYRFYQHPNEELYRMMASLGSVGWNGTFPASFQQHLLRQSQSKPQLASMAADEAAAVRKLRPSAAAQASLEGVSGGRPRIKSYVRGLLKAEEPEETPWYKTMMASWKQNGCRQ